MTTYLIVRAKVDPTVRKTFDNWYEKEHLPDAQKAFDAISARRGWSKMEPNTHIALYEFSNLDVAEKAMSSNYINDLIKEFDRNWEGLVTRTRELLDINQIIQ